MGDDLFQPSSRESAIRDAVVGGEWNSRHPYISGYYRAGRELVKAALKEQAQQFLFYPICFNYRHYVELHLKELIHSSEKFYLKLKEYGQLEGEGKLDEMKRDDLDDNHSLESLLQILENRLEAVSDEPLDPKIRSAIIELHNHDTSGQTFRYARNTSGDPTIPETQQVDLSNLAEQMGEVRRHLVGVENWISYEESRLDEMIEIYRSEMPDPY